MENNYFTEFKNPRHARVNGEPVRILGVGDVAGHSPSFLTINSKGKPKWESIDGDVQFTDTNCLPVAEESLSHISETSESTRSTSSTRR